MNIKKKKNIAQYSIVWLYHVTKNGTVIFWSEQGWMNPQPPVGLCCKDNIKGCGDIWAGERPLVSL